MSNDEEEVARFVTQRASTTSLERIVSQMVDERCQRQSSDNASVYFVGLDRSLPFSENVGSNRETIQRVSVP